MVDPVEGSRNRRVISVGKKPVPGGVELIAYGRSDRGTRYRIESIVVLDGEKSEAEKRTARAAGFRSLLFTAA